MLTKGEVKYGDIIWTQFSPSVGHEFQDKRPAVVIQSNQQIASSNLVTIMPMTGNLENKTVDDIIIEPDGENKLARTSVIKVYNIESSDYKRLLGKIGRCDKIILDKIKKYLRIHFGL